MTKTILEKVRAEYRDLDKNRKKLNEAMRDMDQKYPFDSKEKAAVNDAYQAIVHNMGVIAKYFNDNLK